MIARRQNINLGQPSPEEVVGRSRTIQEIVRHLERGSSVILTGERRIGKSWVLRSIVDRPPKGWVAVYIDVEQIQDIAQLTRVIVERITQKLPRSRRTIERLLAADIDEFKGIPLPQRPVLEPIDQLRRLIRGVASDKKRLILVLDEVPILAQKLEKAQQGGAVAFLQTLRALRQEERNVREILSGSIGFHHILATDAEVKAAVNDLVDVPIGALALDDAELLARNLLAGIGVANPPSEVAARIATATDGVPFYVQQMLIAVERRLASGETLSTSLVDELRGEAIRRVDWQFSHYDERLDEYLGPEASLGRAILDVIATSEGLTTDEISNRAQVSPGLKRAKRKVHLDDVAALIVGLKNDHYITEDATGHRFTFGIVRDAWRSMRGLTAQ